VKIPLMILHTGHREQPRVHPRSTSAPLTAQAASLDGIHVLAVDDEPDALALVCEVLGTAGARVTTAHSVESALAALATEVPDVVLADLGMPKVDGYGFIDQLRGHVNPRVRELPAAALTAYARPQDRMKVLQRGFQIHLVKPIDPAELITTIAALARRVVVKTPEAPSR
jgi:CheY-like chemotaxis protein